MRRYLSHLFGSLMAVAISGCFCSPAVSQEVPPLNQKDAEPTTSNPEIATHFLNVGKGKVADPQELQKREVEAVERIAKSAGRIHPDAVIDSLAENVMPTQQYRRDEVSDPVMKGTEIVNPFIYAVAKAFDGDADGFVLEDGKPTVELRKDSQAKCR